MDSAPTDDPKRSERDYRGQSANARQADRRRRLLDAGMESFGTVGFYGASIEALCASAQVSNRSFYEHFDSKEELLITIYDQLLEDLRDRVVAALSQPPMEFASFVRAGLRAFIDTLLEDERKAQIVIVGLIGVSERCERRRRAALRAFAQVVADGIQTFDPEISRRRNLSVLAMALVGATIEALIDWLSGRAMPVERVLDELVHLYATAVTT